MSARTGGRTSSRVAPHPLKRHSVTGREVKKGSLPGADLADHSVGASKLVARSLTARNLRLGSVTGRELRNGTITTSDLARASVAALHGATGATGATGPRGAVGPTGPAGAAGPAGTMIHLAGYTSTDPQTLPGDDTFHSAWTMTFTARADELYIVTGAIGGASDSGCGSLQQQVSVDGAPAPGVSNGGFLRFSSGPHTLSYDVKDSCDITVPHQEAILVPFLLP
jgi:hypothetical protein